MPAAFPLRLVAAAALSLGAHLASAQEIDAKSHDGTWTARLLGPDGAIREATLVVDGYDGTWLDRAGRRGARGPCAGKKVPVTVQSSTGSLLAFTVWGDTVAPTCPTLTVTVRPTGERSLEGTVDLGSHGSESLEVHAAHAAGAAASGPTTGARPTGSAGSVRLTRR